MPPVPESAHAVSAHAALAGARAWCLAHDEAILATQIAVSEIPAPTHDEGERAGWVSARFRALGLEDVGIDAAGNVFGVRPGSARGGQRGDPVVVCAHLDTVFPRDAIGRARRDGARVYLPGIGDNGRGLAAMLALAEVIDGAAVQTAAPVVFVATTGEEGRGDLHGAKHFFAHAGRVRAAVALDGTGDTRVVHRAVGSLRLRVTIDGPGGHSWSDYGVANPLHASAAMMARITALPLPVSPRTTLTVSRAGGGLSVNSVPQQAWFEVDVRSTSDAPLRELAHAARVVVGAVTDEHNALRRVHTAPLSASVTVIGDRPSGELPDDEPLAVLAWTATRLAGRAPEPGTASTDANVPLSLGIPAIAIGGGGVGGEVHTTSEWYENADGPRGIARALTIVVGAAGVVGAAA